MKRSMKRSRVVLPIVLLAAWCGAAFAQDKGSVDPKPLPPLANPNDPKVPAKELFGRAPTPANLQARAIGFYSKGCLAGGIALPVNGPRPVGVTVIDPPPELSTAICRTPS